MWNLTFRYTILFFSFVLLVSCSHDYESDTLDLGKYQWNMWPDMEASETPSCGWEVLHRGNGKLVRIPAIQDQHFNVEEQSPVVWFHVRHTLPELWEHREISLRMEGVSKRADIYLNEEHVGSFMGDQSPYILDISDKVYYVRDNHLAIRVYDPVSASGGITGKILVVSKPPDQAPRN